MIDADELRARAELELQAAYRARDATKPGKAMRHLHRRQLLLELAEEVEKQEATFDAGR